MHSWLSAYKDKQCTIEPTWSKLLLAFRHVGLTKLATDVESCLKKAPAAISQKEDKKGEDNSIALHVHDLPISNIEKLKQYKCWGGTKIL